MRAGATIRVVERNIKIIVEQHPEGFVAYPLGFRGVVLGEGDSYEDALTDVLSAIAFHIDTFGEDELLGDEPVLAAFVTDAAISA